MKRKMVVGICLLLALCETARAADHEISVSALPAVVVKTVPEAGDVKVDPNVTEIRVTFSKTMHDGSWSWSQISDETKLPSTSKPHYLPDG
jgi:hypothetical protein